MSWTAEALIQDLPDLNTTTYNLFNNGYLRIWAADPFTAIVQQFSTILKGDTMYSKIQDKRINIFIVTKRNPKEIINAVANAESNVRALLKSLEPLGVCHEIEFHIVKDEGQQFGDDYKKIFPENDAGKDDPSTYAIQTGTSWPGPTKRAIPSLF